MKAAAKSALGTFSLNYFRMISLSDFKTIQGSEMLVCEHWAAVDFQFIV